MGSVTTTGPHSAFFTPISSSVLLMKGLTAKTLQIMLILEMRAGTSRTARLSRREIAKHTGYQHRTVDRSLRWLRERDWIRQCEPGVIQLCYPIPTRNYVQVYEGVVFHPQWEDWQKHLLLFVMTQFRSQDREFGIKKYSLNLYGRKGMSIENNCRIPGNTRDRRRQLREFITQLQYEQIMHVVEQSTSNRPAICTINRDVLENLRPDYERHGSATCRMTVSSHETHRHPSRSNTVVRHVAHRHTTRSNNVTRHVAIPSSVTYVKDPEDSEDSKKILESPRAACGDWGAISSLSRNEASLNEGNLGYEKSEPCEERMRFGEDLASFMKSKRNQELTGDIESHCGDFHLRPSRADRHSLAAVWTAVLEELPDDLVSDDVVLAITSSEFDGLSGKSWGLLLSDKFVTRFIVEIKKQYDERQRLLRNTRNMYRVAVEKLKDDDPRTRIAALEYLGSGFPADSRVPLLIAQLLDGERRDSDATVRRAAIRSLIRLDTVNGIPDEYCTAILRLACESLEDNDDEVRDEAEYLRGRLVGRQVEP